MPYNLPQPAEKREYVQQLFGRIAGKYDLLNKIISMGQDSSWRKRVVTLLQPQTSQIYLDIGSGTGDLAREIINAQPMAAVVAVDLTFQMIRVGKNRINSPNIHWIVADAQALPFARKTFNGVVSGYLLRNVVDLKRALEEQIRVIHSGTQIVALDTTPPARNWYFPFVMAYLRFMIPAIGILLSGDRQAYSYLPRSTSHHILAEELAKTLQICGFESVGYYKMMLGTMAIHFGNKPASDVGN